MSLALWLCDYWYLCPIFRATKQLASVNPVCVIIGTLGLSVDSVNFLSILLTPSLPWSLLKMTNKSAEFETFNLLCLLSRAGMWIFFIKTHSVESNFVTGPEIHCLNVLHDRKYTVWMRVRANFSSEILRAWTLAQSSVAVWNSRWPSWAPVPNRPTVSVVVKQHFDIGLEQWRG